MTVERTDPSRYVYDFAQGGRDMADLLGGKGANLAEMTRLGLRVPPGFIVTTEACRAYLHADGVVPEGLHEEVDRHLETLEEATGRRFGDPERPLLLSVRSGARFSMPGMMDTVLDLGLTDTTAAALAAEADDERFAMDSYRRFVQLYGKVVMGVPGEAFEHALGKAVADAGGADETALGASDLRGLVATFKEIVRTTTGRAFPEDPREQLQAAIEAVFRSWNGRRARDYRRHEGISDDLGTAVNVQAMVFGNLGDDSATGVVFTRNPATGEAVPYGDWLPGAQGEDVVAGIRITEHLDTLAEVHPTAHAELVEVMGTLEAHYKDLCDIEFTIERGTLYILQTRVGKRTAAAALKIAVDLVGEGRIDEAEAVGRVSPAQLEQLLHPMIDPTAAVDPLTTGLAASPGAATGAVAFTADEAAERAEDGTAVILVRPETSPDDLHGMIAAQGILTSRGGLVSHAAVVARGMGTPAVCGAEALRFDPAAREVRVGDVVIRDGDVITIDGSTGRVVLGEVPLVVPEAGGDLGTLLGWADRFARLAVRANADTPEDAARAREFGAVGIGLCRTEHMFLGERLPAVQRMILAETEEQEAAALAELTEMQRTDFVGVLQAMDGLPVTVRLLDPPLHEFLPDVEELAVAQARGELDEQGEVLLDAARRWAEENPMLGTRGCRLGILKPGLYRMQATALAQAAVEVIRAGGRPKLEIMIPLVSIPAELELLAGWVAEAVEAVATDADVVLDWTVGTMIETPRAALMADRLARTAAFFSFGTNDLTQLTYGFSRDDVEARVVPAYREQGVMADDPFDTLDTVGVEKLVQLAVADGRRVRPHLKTGICGEHGGEPRSVARCHAIGLDYVSCSPFRVPIARLTAAHANLGVEVRGAGA
jgi:pyruvate, orthophosphate dikinase